MENMYHERQVKELCAIHALNNLFQRQLFSKSDIDEICENLSPSRWMNPHRSLLGTGNYDINVILSALQSKGYAGIWFDKRKDPKQIDLDAIRGLILNTPSAYDLAGLIRLPLNRRHWFAISKINEQYYNLDSKLSAPTLIGNEEQLLEYLEAELAKNDRELFLVVTSQVEDAGSWIKSPSQETQDDTT